eukprot:4210058-Amphidinium_carterae.1
MSPPLSTFDGRQWPKAVRDFWILVGPKLRERPEAWPRVRLPPPFEEEVDAIGLAGPVEHDTQAPHVEGPHKQTDGESQREV